ncbi:MAG: hypothetical protein JXJ17_14290 [Anaerolineae bacterium]|nr:hypothetical protein [Anaerolineae bacterium]
MVNKTKKRKSGFLSGQGFAVFIFLLGAMVTFVIAPTSAAKSTMIQESQEIDALLFDYIEPGTQVVISGVLEGNPAVEGDFVTIAPLIWTVNQEFANGAWLEGGKFVPELNVIAGSGTIPTAQGVNPAFSGRLHEVKDSLEGQPVNGDRWVRGFYNGDTVTIIGETTADGKLRPNEIYGGNREQMVDELSRPSRVWRWIGFGIMASGVGTGLLVSRRRRERERQRQMAM